MSNRLFCVFCLLSQKLDISTRNSDQTFGALRLKYPFTMPTHQPIDKDGMRQRGREKEHANDNQSRKWTTSCATHIFLIYRFNRRMSFRVCEHSWE